MQPFPLVRTEAQARLLGVLFENRDARRPLGQLAQRAGVPLSTASKEVKRLEAMGLVTTESMGRMRIVGANWDLPWSGELATILERTVGIVAQIERALDGLTGVEAAYIFGSWAARHAGTPGRPPGDIDLLVVGHVDDEELRGALRPIEARSHMFVDATIVDPNRWRQADDPFVQTVQSRDLFALHLTDGGGR